MIKEQEITNLEEKKAQLENDLGVLMTSINNTKLEKEQGEEELSVLEVKREKRIKEIGEEMESIENDLVSFKKIKDQEKIIIEEEVSMLKEKARAILKDVDRVELSNLRLVDEAMLVAKAIKDDSDKDISNANAVLSKLAIDTNNARVELASYEDKLGFIKEQISQSITEKTDIDRETKRIMEEYVAIKEKIAEETPKLEEIEKKTAFVNGNYANAKALLSEIEKSTETLNNLQDHITEAKEELKTLAISKEEIAEFTKGKMELLQNEKRLNAKEEYIIEKYNLAGLKY